MNIDLYICSGEPNRRIDLFNYRVWQDSGGTLACELDYMSWGTNCGRTRSPIFKQLEHKLKIHRFGVRIRSAGSAHERPAERRSTQLGWHFSTKLTVKHGWEGTDGVYSQRFDLSLAIVSKWGRGNCSQSGLGCSGGVPCFAWRRRSARRRRT